MEDSLIITYDNCPPDVPTLMIARRERNKIRVLNTIQGDEAYGMYHYLIGGVELVNIKDIPKKVYCEGDDESDIVYCPRCHCYIGSNENVWDDFCHRDWNPMYCTECGQSMIWK